MILGLTFAYLTTILILDAVARAETKTVNGWSVIRKAGHPGSGILVRAALQKALPVVNVFEEAAYWTATKDSSGARLGGGHTYRIHFPTGQLPPNDAFWSLILLAATAVVIWVVGTFAFIYLWPRITVGGFKRIITKRGFGGGPIPVNTLYAVPESPSQSASTGSVIATGTDDILYFGGWLEVKDGPACCTCPRCTIATTACSSPTRPAAPTSPMSASALPEPPPATSSSANPHRPATRQMV